MEEFLKHLGITQTGTQAENGAYVIDLQDYDEYAQIYSILDNASKEGKLDELSDSTQITLHTTDVTYIGDEFQLMLNGNLDTDDYKLCVYNI